MSESRQLNIYDIADEAGVSIATVSRVLSGADNVREATRRKVLDVIEKNNYTPNAFARGLGLGSMKMVGILCTDVSDPFYAKAVSIIERELRALGFDMLLYCTGTDLTDKQRFTGYLLAKHVDAILLVGSAFREQADNSHIENAARSVPVVIINGLVECENTYCILCDEQSAMRENVRLLYESGCRNIAYVYHASTYSGMQKLAGYREGLLECGLGFRPEQVLYSGKSCADAAETVKDLLEGFPEADAILASEDLLAVGAGKALSQTGRRMPVIGFDNSEFAACATPTVTSVDNMLGDMCKGAVDIIGTVLAGGEAPRKTLLKARLVERDTFKATIGR